MRSDHIFRDIGQSVRLVGFHILGIEDAETGLPLFVYTVGMARLQLPDVISFGVRHDSIAPALNTYCLELITGKRKPGPAVIDDWFSVPVTVIEASASMARPYAIQAYAYSEHRGWAPPRFMQWVWPDKSGNLPWELGFDQALSLRQPVLRTN
ncbi:DUF4262 domain-containing protein [Stutzerimonas xanthomarina]|nr:DUF4262 domain-containing protein [Stutzerimonas xanthomarina]|tara:strand:- start:399 stop:857 length:459 start_codon:yes stop_codon:yes gene_type:complete